MKSETYRTILLLFFFVVLLPVWSARAESPLEKNRQMNFGFLFQDYKWAEYADNGNRLLEETGNFDGLTFNIESEKTMIDMIGWRSGVDLFFGDVDYDGRTWTNLPVKTDVLYFGTRLFCDAVPGYRFEFGLFLKPFVGLGGEFWLRNLDDTKTSDGDSVQGAEEWWGCIYGRIGLGAEYPVAKEMAVFAEGGVKLPIYARNEANFYVSGSPRASLEPEQNFSGFASTGVRWKQWGAKFVYDSLRFDRSDAVSSGTFNLYQPKSKSDVYSVVIFWSKGF